MGHRTWCKTLPTTTRKQSSLSACLRVRLALMEARIFAFRIWSSIGRVGDSNVRREVIMVTDGVDRYSGGRFDPEDPYVQAAISDAQKAGVIAIPSTIGARDALTRTGW